MKKIYLIFCLIFSFTEIFSQNKIDNFYTLISSANENKKSAIWTFVKNDDKVTLIDKNRKLSFNRKFSDFWNVAKKQIDSLAAINYKQDTVFVFQYFHGERPYEPFTMIITNQDRIVVGYGSVKHLSDTDGWPYYYDYFHPVAINTITKWDIQEIKELISCYGTCPGEMTGPSWITVDRIVIKDHKKIDTSIIHSDGFWFLNLRKTNIILE